MFMSEKQRPIDFYKEEGREMMIEVVGNGLQTPTLQQQQQQQQQMLLADSSGEDHEMKAPKKRAETWVQEETRSLIALRREMDGLFNTSKSNKHLWEQISSKMRDKGFDRSPTMCTDKWRNLLKEFKKARHHDRGGSGSAKMSYYKELEELIRERNKNAPYKSPPSKVESYMHFSDKGFFLNPRFQYQEGFEYNDSIRSGVTKVIERLAPNVTFAIEATREIAQFRGKIRRFGDLTAQIAIGIMNPGLEDGGIPFGSVEGSGRSSLNLERRLDHDGHPLAITAADAVTANGVPPWNWREAPANGGDNHSSYGGRVILVKWGEYTRRIGIDGTAEAIKEAIKSAFGLRTKRAFWLEDEDEVVRSLDRDMPLGTYTLHLDEGITIKVCLYDDDRIPPEEKTFYTEDDFRDFLTRRGWTGLRELSVFRSVDTLDDVRPGAIYQGVRLLGE